MSRAAGAAALAFVVMALAASSALANPADDAKVRVGTVTLTFNSDGGAAAYCPAGATALGGGFGTYDPPPENVAISTSAPLDATGIPSQTRTGDRPVRWFASMYSGVGSDEEMRIFAICSRSARAHVRVKSFSVPPSKTKATVVSCPSGQRALGGGMNIATNPANGVYEEDSGPLPKHGGPGSVKTGDSPRRWQVAAYNGFGVKRTFEALVVCSASVKPKIVAGEVDVGPGADVENSVICPGGRRALGGGVLVVGNPTQNLQFEQNTPLGAAATVAGTTDGDIAVYWDGDIYNRSAKTRNFKTLAVCA